jgi:hypothetical protein
MSATRTRERPHASHRPTPEVIARHIDAVGAPVSAPDEAGFFTIH